ncbi:MAG TPA: hypothetical protein VN026_09935 [Bacteroidia bacterium]|jgi:hypothetical protein|nr:hypothetical protein [Bacteroidia bacterium]
MSDLKEQIVGVSHSKYANSALYVLFIGMALGNLTPAPSDALYMFYQTKLRDKWKRGEITPEQYWKKNTIGYYMIPFTWWALIAFIVINVKGTSEKKAKIALALVGGSVVLGLVLRMIKVDKKQLEVEEKERTLLLQNHPEVVEILKQPEFENISSQLISSNGNSGIDGDRHKLWKELNKVK